MSRFAPDAHELAPAVLGDRAWRGVNLRLDPQQLPEGYCSEAINLRFRNGLPEPREGSIVMAWLNKITAGTVQPWSAVYGVGQFRDPITFTEYVLIAAEGAVYACLQNNPPRSIPLPEGVTVTDRCTFVQCFDTVILLRGFDADPLAMYDLNVGFEEIDLSTEGTGTLEIPRALRGSFFGNRLYLAREDDTIVASDIGDYTRYTLFTDFKINQGDADRIVALAPFGEASLIILKQRSIYRVDNLYGSLGSISLTLVTARYGCVAADTVVNCGTDLLWLSQEGVASLTLTTQNQVQAGQGALAGKNRMFSEDIGPLIDRVNWNFAENAYATLWNDRYYIALPVDQAEVFGPELISGNYTELGNNAVIGNLTAGATYIWIPGAYELRLSNGATNVTAAGRFVAESTSVTVIGQGSEGGRVLTASLRQYWPGTSNALAHFDFQNAAWGGYDEAAAISFKQVFNSVYLNRQRLFVITHDGYVRMWEEGYGDRLSAPYVDVVVSAQPFDGDSITVNSGTAVTASGDTENNQSGPGYWASLLTISDASENLWADTPGGVETGGYAPYSTSGRWTAPNTNPFKITNGVRFYSTTGTVPVVVTTGSWATVTEVVEQAIATTFITRGYVSPYVDLARFRHLLLDVQTWNPSFTVSLIPGGAFEDTTVKADVTKSRTAYYKPAGTGAYDRENPNNDFDTPYRQDYSVAPLDASFAFTPGDGVRGNHHQQTREAYRLPAVRDRAVRIKIVNSQGRLRLLSAALQTTVRATQATGSFPA
jgi:hypothetical protein